MLFCYFQLIEFFTNRGQLQDALMTAQAASEGYFTTGSSHDENQNIKPNLLRKDPVVNGVDHLEKEGPR